MPGCHFFYLHPCQEATPLIKKVYISSTIVSMYKQIFQMKVPSWRLLYIFGYYTKIPFGAILELQISKIYFSLVELAINNGKIYKRIIVHQPLNNISKIGWKRNGISFLIYICNYFCSKNGYFTNNFA